MTSDAWYRRVTWSEADAFDFQTRLKRARPHKRAQYLRIQAEHLAQSGDRELVPVCLGLLDRMIEEYPDSTDIAQANVQRAECLIAIGDFSKAIECFRLAAESERARPNVQTDAWLEFGWFAVQQEMSELYDESLGLLEEFAKATLFPIQQYKVHGVQALVAAARGHNALAREEAMLALGAARKEHSGFRNHPDLGLVPDSKDGVRQKLERLAAG